MSCLWSLCCPNRMLHTWPTDTLHCMRHLQGWGGPQQQCPGAEHAHTVYLKLYTILQNPGLVVVLPDGSSPEPSSLLACGLLVDPRQLLHNLNDLIHGGFTLHATAVINLGLGDRKLLGGHRNHPTQPVSNKPVLVKKESGPPEAFSSSIDGI